MINIMKYSYYALFSVVCFASSAIIAFIPIFIFSLTKLVIQVKRVRYLCTSVVEVSVSLWLSFAILITKLFSPTKFELEQNVKLDSQGSYLIICNHKSWLDTFILMLVFHKKIAFPKFVIKFQVFFIPVLGLIAWALEFPVMKRYSKEYLNQHPEKKDEDLQKTLAYCKKLSPRPTIIINFVEGTRFTLYKALKSNYKNLLNPKAGGIAIILKSLSDRIVGILNTIIVYDNPEQNLWSFMVRKTKKIKIKVELIPITEVPVSDYFSNNKDKYNFQLWLNKLWHNNDQYISEQSIKDITI